MSDIRTQQIKELAKLHASIAIQLAAQLMPERDNEDLWGRMLAIEHCQDDDELRRLLDNLVDDIFQHLAMKDWGTFDPLHRRYTAWARQIVAWDEQDPVAGWRD